MPAVHLPAEPRWEPFDFGDLRGEVAVAWRPPDLEAEVRRLIDPAAATSTLHWGRNYLYRAQLATAGDPLGVVVKQFRSPTGLRGLHRRLTGSKALRSWRAALAFLRAGVPTAEPVLLVEPARPGGGASCFVTRDLGDVLEARFLLRAASAGREREDFPGVDFPRFLADLGALLRRMHEAGLWHRDLSIGNVLLRPGPDGSVQLYLIDLNRSRQRRRLSLGQRTRDLCRLALFRPEHQELFLRSYWGPECTGAAFALRRTLYRLCQRAFLGRIEAKKQMRGGLGNLGRLLRPRRAHAHIPPAPADASARDKIVWDPLSDQPHQHAGRLEKLSVRLADAGLHAETTAVVLAALPRIWHRYRQLRRDLCQTPSAAPAGDGIGLCLRPQPGREAELLAAVADLGVRRLLLRLHPWDEDHGAELELARELHQRGSELTFALPQNRELVKDPGRWRAAVTRLAEAFLPYGRHFQIGQAVNRSKWGVWNYGEYVRLYTTAAEVLRARGDVQLLGPAVIDFEYHATAALLNLRRAGLHFDVVSALLYVDRRGAPENRQVGLDTVAKALLLKAVAQTGRNAGDRCWITEFNWPLWEGPHSPAGREVSVDEQTQADYLVRYYLLALGSGAVERVYWWQLAAKGYGLVDPTDSRRRPSFHALATLVRELAGCRFLGPLPAGPDVRLMRYQRPPGGELVIGWSLAGSAQAALPRRPEAVFDRGGQPLPLPAGRTVELEPAPRYFHLPAESG